MSYLPVRPTRLQHVPFKKNKNRFSCQLPVILSHDRSSFWVLKLTFH
jgi:hypothetical protein